MEGGESRGTDSNVKKVGMDYERSKCEFLIPILIFVKGRAMVLLKCCCLLLFGSDFRVTLIHAMTCL